MSGTGLAQQLQNFTRSLREQGILDHRFDQLKELEDENPCLTMEVITMALRDADNGIAEVTRNLSEPVVNYPKVKDLAHKLKGSSSSVGGCWVAAACIQLREASDLNNKHKMEHTINANEPKRRRQ